MKLEELLKLIDELIEKSYDTGWLAGHIEAGGAIDDVQQTLYIALRRKLRELVISAVRNLYHET